MHLFIWQGAPAWRPPGLEDLPEGGPGGGLLVERAPVEAGLGGLQARRHLGGLQLQLGDRGHLGGLQGGRHRDSGTSAISRYRSSYRKGGANWENHCSATIAKTETGY